MNIQDVVRESQLENHIDIFGFLYTSGKEEYVRQCKESFSSTRSILETRAKQVLQIREELEKNTLPDVHSKEIQVAEKVLKQYIQTEETTTGEQQVFFYG